VVVGDVHPTPSSNDTDTKPTVSYDELVVVYTSM
jgi:hypothetical protein